MPGENGAEMRIHTSRVHVHAVRAATSRARKRGSGLIEFVLASSIFLAFLFGIIDFCRAVYAYEFVTYAARAGARWAMVRGNQCSLANPASWCEPASGATTGATAADIQTYVRSLNLPGINPSQITATTTWPTTGSGCISANGSNSPGCPVKVLVQFPYASSIPFVRMTTLTLTAESQLVISQ
jgi:Flp pilus assembly protein TadG